MIQTTRLGTGFYPRSLPSGCTLRLHPCWIPPSSRPRPAPQRRLFTLAHNASLLPLAKAPAADGQLDRHVDVQPISYVALPSPGVPLLSDSSSVSGALPLAPSPGCGAEPLAAARAVPDVIRSRLPVGTNVQPNVSGGHLAHLPVLPLPSLSSPNTTNTMMPCSATMVRPGCFLLQMVYTPQAPPTAASQHALGHEIHRSDVAEQQETSTKLRPNSEEDTQVEEEESSPTASTLSPPSPCAGEAGEEEEECTVGVVSLNGGETNGGEEEETREGDGAGGGGEEEAGEEGKEEQGEGGEEDRQREDGGGEREEDGEKDKDEDQDRQGEEEEEEDFDDLTQDEDEEEVMSSASEESVLSVPELQVNRKSTLTQVSTSEVTESQSFSDL